MKMAETFFRHWPSAVGLRIYTEGFESEWPGHSLLTLAEAAPWLEPWKAARTLSQHGMRDGKYNYRFDAVKFAHKVAAIGAAAEGNDCDVLIWMDADIVTHSLVAVDWLDSLLPLEATLAWLERAVKYPECGFMMFRMPASGEVVREVVKAYQSGAIFKLDEWHDSFVFWHYVKAAKVATTRLAPLETPKRHPFVNSVLGEKMDHFKGTARKGRGKSFQTDLVKPRREAYWR